MDKINYVCANEQDIKKVIVTPDNILTLNILIPHIEDNTLFCKLCNIISELNIEGQFYCVKSKTTGQSIIEFIMLKNPQLYEKYVYWRANESTKLLVRSFNYHIKLQKFSDIFIEKLITTAGPQHISVLQTLIGLRQITPHILHRIPQTIGSLLLHYFCEMGFDLPPKIPYIVESKYFILTQYLTKQHILPKIINNIDVRKYLSKKHNILIMVDHGNVEYYAIQYYYPDNYVIGSCDAIKLKLNLHCKVFWKVNIDNYDYLVPARFIIKS